MRCWSQKRRPGQCNQQLCRCILDRRQAMVMMERSNLAHSHTGQSERDCQQKEEEEQPAIQPIPEPYCTDSSRGAFCCNPAETWQQRCTRPYARTFKCRCDLPDRSDPRPALHPPQALLSLSHTRFSQQADQIPNFTYVNNDALLLRRPAYLKDKIK